VRLRALGSRGSGMVDELLLCAVMVATAAVMITMIFPGGASDRPGRHQRGRDRGLHRLPPLR